ncbi:MAG: DinB family protein [Spirochaetaceae bacterium]|nr:DinB family protein [Spirochaetaceae bacterium]
MKKDTVTLLAEYTKSANGAMNQVIEKLDAGEWEKPLGGYFPSVRSLCSHIYICDFNWLKRFSKFREFALFAEPFFSRESYSWSEVLFAGKDEYLAKRPELDGKLIAFAGEVRDGDLSATLKYTDSGGTGYEKNFGNMVLHMFNHGTHHRGMISLYLELLGRQNDFNSLSVYL